MSKHVRNIPSVFLHYHGLTLPQYAADEAQVGEGRQRRQQKGDSSDQHPASSALLRDDHIALLAIDALLSLHASFKKWRDQRRTSRALADLNDYELRDIGLIREGDQYRALTEQEIFDSVKLRLD